VILAIDTDVLVSWIVVGSPRHVDTLRFLNAEVRERGVFLALTPLVIHEFLHVVTDPKRLEKPLPMDEALRRIWKIWDAEEVVRITPSSEVLPRTLELLTGFQLGRKRILDTALAATLELAEIRRLVTFNPSDFRIFKSLEVVTPPLRDSRMPDVQRE
jgi:predicted nucleic acid-binding protein